MPIDRSVLVHSCYCTVRDKPFSALVSEMNYVPTELGKVGSTENWYHVLPPKCKCRRRVTLNEAVEWLEVGDAQPVVRYTTGGILDTVRDSKWAHRDGTYGGTPMIWMPIVRTQTPRVDLVTPADMERAVCCTCPRRTPPFQKYHGKDCSGRRFQDYIEEIHEIYRQGRLAITIDEPGLRNENDELGEWFDGRVLFIKFNEPARPSLGRDVTPEEWNEIQTRIVAPQEEE